MLEWLAGWLRRSRSRHRRQAPGFARAKPGLFMLALLPLLAHAAVQVRDDRGTPVSFDRPPQRIVSLLPSLSEVVCVLDACQRLVGVDDYSDWPPAVRALPHLGGLEDVRIEAVLALQPDLVLVPGSSRALERLQRLGLRTLVLEPRTLADLQRVLATLGPVLAAGDDRQAWRRIAEGIAASALPPALRGLRVYFEVGAGPYAAGESSFIGELLARMGAANVVPAALGPFPKLNPEFVVRADPDVIFARDDARELARRPGWSRMRAVRDGHVCTYTAAQGELLMRPGPRLPEAAQLMLQCLRGAGSKAR